MERHSNTRVSATRFIRKLRGSSQPILVGASDGRKYVIKFPNNLQGPNVLCNEALGTELYSAIGLPVPAWAPITISERFIAANPECRLEGPHGWVEPEAGLCFGSALIGDSVGSPLEILPGTFWARLSNRSDFWLAWIVDLCADHWDNRQAVFLQDCGVLSAVFIDHGHMFGGPDGRHKTPLLGPRHLDHRVYTSLDKEARMNLLRICGNLITEELLKKAAMIPDTWATDSAIQNYLGCVDRLSRADIWEKSLQTILASVECPHAKTVPTLDKQEFPRVLRSRLRIKTSRRGAVA